MRVSEMPFCSNCGAEVKENTKFCDKCGNDWENEWWTENGDVGESQLRRKFWG